MIIHILKTKIGYATLHVEVRHYSYIVPSNNNIMITKQYTAVQRRKNNELNSSICHILGKNVNYIAYIEIKQSVAMSMTMYLYCT